MTNKIGGFLGIARTRTTSQIIFDNNQYYVGDQVLVKIICDNSLCSNAVKEFKLKLHCFYTVKNEDGLVNSGLELIKVFKAPGCQAKTKIEQELSIHIPTISDVKHNFIQGNWDLRHRFGKEAHFDKEAWKNSMANVFSTSVQGQMFKLEHTLTCYIKHDAWNEVGQGNRVMLPIKILQQPIKIRAKKINMPDDWKPEVQPEV